jgi:predicted Zn-dependent protease
MTHHLERSGYSSAALSAEFVRLHARMRTKLFAFIRPLHRTLKKYPPTDVSVDARYARAIAYYLKPDLARALPLIDGLIAADRANPYFHELKGQMLFENGRVKEALAPYRTAVRLLPESSLLRISLAQTLIETGREAETREAARHLQSALADEKNNGFAWRLMATAHGRTGRMGLSFLALAEEALIQLRMREAIRLADKSKKKIAYGSPDWLRAEDIIAAATEGMSDMQKEKYKRDRESKGKPRRQR